MGDFNTDFGYSQQVDGPEYIGIVSSGARPGGGSWSSLALGSTLFDSGPKFFRADGSSSRPDCVAMPLALRSAVSSFPAMHRQIRKVQ